MSPTFGEVYANPGTSETRNCEQVGISVGEAYAMALAGTSEHLEIAPLARQPHEFTITILIHSNSSGDAFSRATLDLHRPQMTRRELGALQLASYVTR